MTEALFSISNKELLLDQFFWYIKLKDTNETIKSRIRATA